MEDAEQDMDFDNFRSAFKELVLVRGWRKKWPDSEDLQLLELTAAAVAKEMDLRGSGAVDMTCWNHFWALQRDHASYHAAMEAAHGSARCPSCFAPFFADRDVGLALNALAVCPLSVRLNGRAAFSAALSACPILPSLVNQQFTAALKKDSQARDRESPPEALQVLGRMQMHFETAVTDSGGAAVQGDGEFWRRLGAHGLTSGGLLKACERLVSSPQGVLEKQWAKELLQRRCSKEVQQILVAAGLLPTG
ncbi:unnamed protein product, partial [Effrenium voratum]